MIVDISIAASAAAFVALAVFLIITLVTARKTLRQTNRTLGEIQKNIEGLTEASVELIEDVDDLTRDIRKKSEALDVVFRPLYALKKEKSEHKSETKHDRLSEIFEYLAQGVVLFNHLRRK